MTVSASSYRCCSTCSHLIGDAAAFEMQRPNSHGGGVEPRGLAGENKRFLPFLSELYEFLRW